ncbi:hypothetical protein MMC11_004267 [Xylographa trunciseda]|nr:hypothetical protein [Xylographa trunciseda]
MKSFISILVFLVVLCTCYSYRLESQNGFQRRGIESAIYGRNERTSSRDIVLASKNLQKIYSERRGINRDINVSAQPLVWRSTFDPIDSTLSRRIAQGVPVKNQGETPSSPSKASPPKSAAPKSSSPKQYEQFVPGGPNDAYTNARKENMGRTTCKTANDCHAVCSSKKKDPKSKHSSIESCIKDPKTSLGICKCGESNDEMDKLMIEVAKALGDIPKVACAVFQKAIFLGIDLGSMMIPGAGEAVAAEKVALTAAKAGLKAAGKAAMINFCGSDNKYVGIVDNAVPI